MQILFRTVPIYFWFFTIWSISKLFQDILNEDKTLWELIWDKSVTFFGMQIFIELQKIIYAKIFKHF